MHRKTKDSDFQLIERMILENLLDTNRSQFCQS